MIAKGSIVASDVFLILTTQLYSCLCNYNVIVFISWQKGSMATEIFPNLNTPLASLPVGSKIPNYSIPVTICLSADPHFAVFLCWYLSWELTGSLDSLRSTRRLSCSSICLQY